VKFVYRCIIMKIIFLGDIVGKTGREAVKKVLPKLKKKFKPDIVIANCENISHGSGASNKTLDEMKDAGINYFTAGNHIFKGVKNGSIWERDDLVRPLNYPSDSRVPGVGFLKMKILGEEILLVSLQGLVFMPEYIESPFRIFKEFLSEHKNKLVVVDFHGEATSEKITFGLAFDGKASAVFGTHTHIQTADERILPGGTAYITDAGMCGSQNSSIGIDFKEIIKHFETGLKFKTEPGEFPAIVCGVLVDIDFSHRKAKKITRIFEVVK